MFLKNEIICLLCLGLQIVVNCAICTPARATPGAGQDQSGTRHSNQKASAPKTPPDTDAFIEEVQAAIKIAWNKLPVKRDSFMIAVVKFNVGEHGELINPHVFFSSRSSQFDDSAMEALRRAQLPRPPEGMSVPVSIEFAFTNYALGSVRKSELAKRYASFYVRKELLTLSGTADAIRQVYARARGESDAGMRSLLLERILSAADKNGDEALYASIEADYGEALVDDGEWAQAEPILLSALERLRRTEPGGIRLACVQSYLARCYSKKAQSDEDKDAYSQRARHFASEALRSFSRQPDSEERIKGLKEIAWILCSNQQNEEAERAFNEELKAVERFRRVTESDEIASVLTDLAHIARYRGNNARAHDLYTKALNMHIRCSGLRGEPVSICLFNMIAFTDRSEQRWVESVLESMLEREEKELGTVLPRDLVTLADFEYEHRNFRAAIPLYRRASKMDLSSAIDKSNMDSRRTRSSTTALIRLGEVLYAENHISEALQCLMTAYQKLQGDAQISDYRLREVRLALSSLLERNKRFQQCRTILQSALEIDEEPAVHQLSLGDLAQFLTRRGLTEEALKYYMEKLKADYDQGDPLSYEALNSLAHCADILHKLGREDEVEKLYEENLRISQQNASNNCHLDSSYSMSHRAWYHFTHWQKARALSELDEVIKLRTQLLPPHEADEALRPCRFNLALVQHSLGNDRAAVNSYREIIDNKEVSLKKRSEAMLDLARFYTTTERRSEAANLYQQELNMISGQQENYFDQRGRIRRLICALFASGQYWEAERVCDKYTELVRTKGSLAHGPNETFLTALFSDRIESLEKRGAVKKIAELYEHEIRHPTIERWQNERLQQRLPFLYIRLGQLERARSLLLSMLSDAKRQSSDRYKGGYWGPEPELLPLLGLSIVDDRMHNLQQAKSDLLQFISLLKGNVSIPVSFPKILESDFGDQFSSEACVDNTEINFSMTCPVRVPLNDGLLEGIDTRSNPPMTHERTNQIDNIGAGEPEAKMIAAHPANNAVDTDDFPTAQAYTTKRSLKRSDPNFCYQFSDSSVCCQFPESPPIYHSGSLDLLSWAPDGVNDVYWQSRYALAWAEFKLAKLYLLEHDTRTARLWLKRARHVIVVCDDTESRALLQQIEKHL